MAFVLLLLAVRVSDEAGVEDGAGLEWGAATRIVVRGGQGGLSCWGEKWGGKECGEEGDEGDQSEEGDSMDYGRRALGVHLCGMAAAPLEAFKLGGELFGEGGVVVCLCGDGIPESVAHEDEAALDVTQECVDSVSHLIFHLRTKSH